MTSEGHSPILRASAVSAAGTGLSRVMGALRDVVRGLRAEGRCVLFSSHVMQEVAALCDDIVIVGSGRVVTRGTPDEIRAATGREDLEDAFVAALGSAEGLE